MKFLIIVCFLINISYAENIKNIFDINDVLQSEFKNTFIFSSNLNEIEESNIWDLNFISYKFSTSIGISAAGAAAVSVHPNIEFVYER